MILFNNKDYYETNILNLFGVRYGITPLGRGSWTRAYRINNTDRVILASCTCDTTKDAMVKIKNKHVPKIKFLGETKLPASRIHKKVYETVFYNTNREEWTKESNDIYNEIRRTIGTKLEADMDTFLISLAVAKIPLRVKNALKLLFNATMENAKGDVGWDFGYGNVAEDSKGNIIFLDIFYDTDEF